jgi:hypothetical protein
MKIWTWTALAWAALISAAARSEPAAAWLAAGTIAFAPLALAALAALARPRQGAIRAIDAEALAWSQPSPPAGRPPAGRAVPASSVGWRAQPLSA